LLFCLSTIFEHHAESLVQINGHNINSSAIMTTNNKKHFSWLALGDSYTIGEAVAENERFPAQTIALLQQENMVADRLEYIAVTGWTTIDLLNAIAAKKPQGPFDVVTLLIGVNDQYQHLDAEGYKKRFTECLGKAISLAGNKKEHVFVLSIPDYSVTPFAKNSDTVQIKKELEVFNAINHSITASENISYTGITTSTRLAQNDLSLIAGDGLHPSGKEYAKWAMRLAKAIKKMLDKNG
jgi:lysophospholipase L1-like esterase